MMMMKNSNNNKKRSREEIDSSSWAFEVDYNDHFETPKKAYEDLLPFLSAISKHCTAAPKNLNDLIVYDPYYCKGSVVSLKLLVVNSLYYFH